MIRIQAERVTKGKALVLSLLLVAFVAASLLAAKPAHAISTFTVDSTADTNLTACTAAANDCTLRGAINAANATANSGGPDAINFAIPGAGPHTISPTSSLPSITEAVTIDGYTQPGASANTLAQGTNAVPKIELNGTSAGVQSTGLNLAASNIVVRGLVINRFGFNGVDLFGNLAGPGIKLEGNFIGTDTSGTSDLGNEEAGVFENSQVVGSLTIGGTTPQARNLISGNNNRGITIFGAGGNKVQGNLIGTQKDGTSALANSGNGDGVFVISGSLDNTVGGTTAGAANTIAFNADDGVEVGGGDPSSTGNRILSNSIFSNSKLGINLSGGTEDVNGVTANDGKDPDTGANNLQNKPKITSASSSSVKATIHATLNSTPNTKFTVQGFSNPPGEDEGKTFLKQSTIKTDNKGKASFTLIAGGDLSGQQVTATATNKSTGDTSEFSGAKVVS
jgi:CSLREA domain-containing protein